MTPTIVGKIGANTRPASTTAAVAIAVDVVMIITRIAAIATSASTAISRTPIAVRFFTIDVRKRPTIMAAPKRLRMRPARATAPGFEAPPNSSVMYGLLQVPMLTSSEM